MCESGSEFVYGYDLIKNGSYFVWKHKKLNKQWKKGTIKNWGTNKRRREEGDPKGGNGKGQEG